MKKKACLGAMMFALAAVGATFESALNGEVSITGKATARVDRRIARDFPIRRDMTQVKSFRFDLRVSNLADFSSYICYFKSGGGWYKATLELPED
ncbi:MAG: hypothetical protein IJL17_22995, partial [Kiritimatiellae bacterium]|nr:hypothetical protein [Kiritimatiellia bacterium]